MNFRTFDLNLLRVLDALLSERSTTAAAHRLGLSQPAVSAALSRLRRALDDPIFVRHGRALEPTDFALALQDPLRRIHEQTETLLSGPAAFDPATAEIEFRLSGSDFYSELLMPRLADLLRRTAPGIRVMMVDLVPDNHVDTLARYAVDLALLPECPLPNWIEGRPAHTSTFTAIARRDHPRLAAAGLAPGDTIPLDLFCALGHALFSPEGKAHGMADAALAKLGRKRHVTASLPTFAGVYNAVSGSDLIALLPDQLATRIAPRAGLSLYRAPVSLPTVRIQMIWPRRSGNAPAHRWLRNRVADLLSTLNQESASRLTEAPT